MYLKRIEIQGFKSFADKTILEFKDGITSVIGPNGSGKSNISDAVRWVLGEQSIKSLRGAKSEDIIFAGTQARKSLGFAEVSMIIDNQDGKLPIEYSEVIVTRKIFRSGETGYYINKTPCRLKDVLELFMDTGIGKDGYSIIGQGKIDEILSNKSEDRRKIFEEAAGIVKFRTRKAESEKKLEQTKLNLLRINDILVEIENTIEPLKIQSDKAKQFLSLKEELKNIEIGLFIYNIEIYKERLEQIKKDEEIFINQKEDEENKSSEYQLQKENLKRKVNDITNLIEEMQNECFGATNKVEKINSEIAISNQKIANNNEKEEIIKEELVQIQAKVKELEEEISQKEIKKENLLKNKEKFRKELEEKEKVLSELNKKLSDKEKEIEAYKKSIEENIDKKYEISESISNRDINIENIEKRIKSLNQEKDSLISELDSARISKFEIEKEFNKIKKQKEDISKDLDEKNQEKQKALITIEDFDKQLNVMQDESRVKTSKLKFLIETEKEKEGYNKSVKSLLLACEKNEKLKQGMYDVLANLVQTEKKYEIAIEMCLGFTLQNIVTQSEQDAKKLIEYLRVHKLGRVSFLPIASVKGKKLDKIVTEGIDGIIGIASDLVKYDSKYKGIIENLLGRTVIVDNMENAIKLSKQNKNSFRIVTIDGDIINTSGAITGGSIATKSVSIIGRSREIDTLKVEIGNITKKIEEVVSKKSKYADTITDVIEEVALLEKKVQEIDIVYATERQKMLGVEENINKANNKKNKINEEIEEIKKQKESYVKQKDEAKLQLVEIESEISKLTELVDVYSSDDKENQQIMSDLNFDITNLKISVSSFEESNVSLEEMLDRVKVDIDSYEKSLKQKHIILEDVKNANINIEEKIEALKIEAQNVEINVDENKQKIQDLKEERISKNGKIDKLEKNILEQIKLLEELNEQIIKIEIKKTKTSDDLSGVINSLWLDYEMTPNQVGEVVKPSNVQATQKEVNTIKSKIRDLGSINIDSIEEYKKNKERYEYMCEQRLDLENTIGKLREIIVDMTNTMQKQFSEKFKQINKNFDEVFKELFGGGKAELILEDENNILECGIGIQVQPAGKKLQNMMLLSGGEKAFTAIALLFAILKINPAPFCILDEIEAALDDVNVNRFAEYLKVFSDKIQFLVITHRKGTMESANTVYGVTMEENGISKLLSIKLS